MLDHCSSGFISSSFIAARAGKFKLFFFFWLSLNILHTPIAAGALNRALNHEIRRIRLGWREGQ